MNLKRKKKGFTIVELVIVLAVIGILAAILIPTFVNVVNRANEAKDKSLVYNLNEALILEEIDHNGKYATMHDTLQAMDKNQGFGIDRIKVKSKDSEVLWDSVNNRFVLVTTGKNDSKTYYNGTDDINYPVLKGDNKIYEVDLWRISDTVDSNSPYSTYYTGTAESVTTSKGFDAGNTNVDVTYDNETNQNVVIRTNGGNLTVDDASNGTIYHYGDAETVEIIECHTSSYHENGTVAFVEIAKGRIVLEAESEVGHIHVDKIANEETFDTVIIAKEKEVEMPTLSRDDVKIADEGTLVVALQDGTEKVTSSTQLDYVWLTKQGVYEQITISDKKDTAGTNWVNTSDKSEEKKEAAKQIANNVGRDADGNIEATVTVGETTYEVVLDSERNLVLIEENGNPETPAYTLGNDTTGAVVVKDENNATVEAVVEVVEAAADKEAVQIGATLFAGGSGAKNDPWMIVDYDTMQKVSEVYHNTFGYGVNYYYNLKDNNGNWVCDTKEDAEAMAIANGYNRNNNGPFYFKVKDGISAIDCNQDGRSWIPVELLGYFDGNGVVFNNVNKGLFSSANGDEVIIKNFTINANISVSGGVGAVVYDSNTLNLTIDSVDVHGTIIGANWVTPYVEFGPGPSYVWNLTIKNSVSDATLVAISGVASGFVGHPYDDVSNGADNKGHLDGLSTITIIDSAYIGNMTATDKVTGNNFKYFTINGNNNRIKTYYSEEFIDELGYNPEGTLYATPTTGYDNKGKTNEVEYLVINNEDGSKTFFCGNSGKNVVDNYKPTEKKAVLNTTSQATLPANVGDVFTINKVSGAVKAVISLQIAPNDKNNFGGYLGTYMSEEIDISSVASGSTFTSEEVRYFTININSGATSKTGVSGNIFNVVNSYYGKNAHNGASVKIAQFDANGNVLNITSIQIAAPHAAE